MVLEDGEWTMRNGKGVWLREIEKMFKRFEASLEWLMVRVGMRDEEMGETRQNGETECRAKIEALRIKRMKSIDVVLDEVNVLIDTHFYDAFSQTKSSMFLKKVVANQFAIDMNLFKRTWRT